MRLHIGVLGAEEPLGPLDRQILGDIHSITAAVIAFARVSLGILVCEHAAQCRQHSRRDIIFTGDQLDAAGLTAALHLNGLIQLRVRFRQHATRIRQIDPGRKRLFNRCR
jgi:hypothetical protein